MLPSRRERLPQRAERLALRRKLFVVRRLLTNRAVVRHLVDNERVYATAVINEHNAAIEQGVTAVPTIVLDDVLPVQGAQDLESYERWIERLLERRSG